VTCLNILLEVKVTHFYNVIDHGLISTLADLFLGEILNKLWRPVVDFLRLFAFSLLLVIKRDDLFFVELQELVSLLDFNSFNLFNRTIVICFSHQY
jgi:hypothetical protein